MKIIPRRLASEVARAARAFPAVVITGPRRAGKTTLLRALFPKASFALLEDPDLLSRVRADPRGFLASLKTPAILDEIQNAPELLNYLRTLIDIHPAQKGKWFITGSQEAPLMRGVTESMAGRAAVFQLCPFSLEESSRVTLERGGYPEVAARPGQSSVWFRSYLQTYLERDVRSISDIHNLATFRRFLSLLATRTGCVLNRTDLAAPLGVSVPTITEWINILEVTGQILLVHPFYENLGKRLIKSPKIYIADSGMACFLLGFENLKSLAASPFLGPVFEGFVASEVVKAQINHGKRRELYYFRDRQGLEVDFIVPSAAGKWLLLEAKSTRTPTPAMAEPLLRLVRAAGLHETQPFVVHSGPALSTYAGLGHGVRAVAVNEIASLIQSGGK